MPNSNRPRDTWEPPSHQPSSPFETSGNGGSHGDIRERLRAIEVWLHHLAQSTAERHGAHVRRLELQERRMTGHQARLTEGERRSAEIAPLSERVTAIEKKLRHAKERIQYAAAAVIFGMVMGGQMTLDRVFQIVDILRRLLAP